MAAHGLSAPAATAGVMPNGRDPKGGLLLLSGQLHLSGFRLDDPNCGPRCANKQC